MENIYKEAIVTMIKNRLKENRVSLLAIKEEIGLPYEVFSELLELANKK